nr:putative integron gene cassette protein [uncultured bacterium]
MKEFVMQSASVPGSTGPSKALWELAVRCATAWSSGDPEGMASCYEETGRQSINNGPPAIGREALSEVATSYMVAFPDLQIALDQLLVAGDAAFFVWTVDRNQHRTQRHGQVRSREWD